LDFAIITISAFIVGLGFLVKRNPNLIAGYNGLSEQEKRKVDIEGLSTWMRNGFVITGLATPLVYFLVGYFGYQQLADFSMMFTITIGTFVIAISSQRFRNK